MEVLTTTTPLSALLGIVLFRRRVQAFLFATAGYFFAAGVYLWWGRSNCPSFDDLHEGAIRVQKEEARAGGCADQDESESEDDKLDQCRRGHMPTPDGHADMLVEGDSCSHATKSLATATRPRQGPKSGAARPWAAGRWRAVERTRARKQRQEKTKFEKSRTLQRRVGDGEPWQPRDLQREVDEAVGMELDAGGVMDNDREVIPHDKVQVLAVAPPPPWDRT